MNDLRVLEKYRDALLLAEIAAWLHMIGKFQEEFLERGTRFSTKIPQKISDEFLILNSLITDNWVGNIWNILPLAGTQTEKLSIAHLIKSHERGEDLSAFHEGFRRLFIDAHGRGSGIEKGGLNKFLQPHKDPVYLSTALGYETAINYADIKQKQQELYDFLQKKLGFLKKNNAKLSYEEWSFFQTEYIKKIYQYFSITVADNRRPLNDVTLFDQTAMSVAFFKAALAQNLLQGIWQEPAQNKPSKRYHWRLLRVGIDGMAFWGNAVRIGDLLARKEHINKALDQVRQLLEIKYPLGAEVYRDENGSIFIVSNIEQLLACTDESQSLEQRIQAFAGEQFVHETQFTLCLSKPTRDTLLFSELATRTLPKPAPQITWLQSQWQGVARDICPVCGFRPQADPASKAPQDRKAAERKVCVVCETRRADRSAQWIDDTIPKPQTTPDEPPAPTIWLDEVADIHGQLALIAARFETDTWLSGSAFNTVPSFDPEARLVKGVDFNLQVLINDIQNGLRPGQTFEDNLLGRLFPDENTRGGSNRVEDFYDLRIKDTDLDAISSSRNPELLALSLIRQSPSFARISRTWETTRNFWKEIVNDFSNTVGKANTRIKLHGNFLSAVSDKTPLAFTHTYELKLGSINLSITCTKTNEEFLTVENLQRVALLLGAPHEALELYETAATYVCHRIELECKTGKGFKIEEPTGYSRLNRALGELQITKIEVLPASDSINSYIPAIPILTEPQTFMALVPANRAWNVAQDIKKKFEQKIGKVRNRLPLAMGIVFSNRRTPLPAILDAGRRMLRQSVREEPWVIDQKVGSAGSHDVVLTLKKGDSTLKIEIPVVMGDGTTPDANYPYWQVASDKDGNKPIGRDRQFTVPPNQVWVHACNLHIGDMVHLRPSRFDFELLDTAARRFEISYEQDTRRGRLRPGRPYYLEQLDDFEQLWTLLADRLVISQIDNLIGLIEIKRQEWLAQQDDNIFRTAVYHIVANANWQKPLSEKDLLRLTQAAISGQLTDVVELYITILKRKTSIDWMEGTIQQ